MLQPVCRRGWLLRRSVYGSRWLRPAASSPYRMDCTLQKRTSSFHAMLSVHEHVALRLLQLYATLLPFCSHIVTLVKVARRSYGTYLSADGVMIICVYSS